MKKNVFIAIAAAMAIGGLSTAATAAVGTFAAHANKNVGVEATSTVKAAVAPVNAVYTTGTTGILSTVQPATFTLKTSAGLFVTGSTALNSAAGLLTGTAATVPTSGIGTNTLTWTAVGAVATPATDTLTFATKLDLNGVAAGTTVDYTLTALTAGGVILGTPVTVSGGVTGANVLTVGKSFSTAVTAATDTADVAGGFVNFKASGTAVGATNAISVTQNTNLAPNATVNALITLSGDFSAIKSIAISGATGSTAAGVTTAVTGTTKGVSGQLFIDTAAGKAYGVAAVAAATTVALNPIFTASGAAIPASTYTVDVALLADANVAAGAVGTAGATAYTISRNGASFTSNNISSASIIRIADNNATTTLAAPISISAWDAAGASVTEIGATLPTSLLGGHTVTIAAGVLKAAFPTAVRFNINVESSNVSVTHLKNVGTGLNVVVQTTGTAKQL